MKTLLRFFLVVVMTSSVRAAEVTADQLARYFGITSNPTTVWLPPQSYVVEIHEIKEGKIGRLLIGTEARWAKTEREPYTVMLGREGEKLRVVLFVGNGSTLSTSVEMSTMGGSTFPPLPEFIKEPGDHVIFGHGDLRGIKDLNDIKGYENGLVLRVVSRKDS